MDGLDYADQRYYSSAVGRFTTLDPMRGATVADPGSWNKYAYVGGDPINFRDLSGRFRCNPEYCEPDEPENPIPIGPTRRLPVPRRSDRDWVMYPTVEWDSDILSLIDESRHHVLDILRDNLNCAGSIGTGSKEAATARANTISIGPGGMAAGAQGLDLSLLNQEGRHLAQAMQWLFITSSICLNMYINWKDAATPACLADGIDCQTRDLAAAEVWRVGAASLTAEKFMTSYVARVGPRLWFKSSWRQ